MEQKNKRTYVVGHKNPDTDSICSAIAYANLKSTITGEDFAAKRAGLINEETQYVLKKFGVEAPRLLSNVKLQVKDMSVRWIAGISPNLSIKKTWDIMQKENTKTLPVLVDEELVGIISTGDIAHSYMMRLSYQEHVHSIRIYARHWKENFWLEMNRLTLQKVK